jgi:4-methyl-5(b-hydroxyethyl)-thiazole monophosphate biosynthesis
MAKKALMILAEGFEDIEAVAPIDVLNRCGIEVTIASLSPGPVKASYGSVLHTDTTIEMVDDNYDAVIFPGGGKNAKALAAHPKVKELVHAFNDKGKLVAAICASPSHVLAEAAGILKGRKATGDPGHNEIMVAAGATVTDHSVTVDGNIITAMGPGAALQFGLIIAEYLVGKEKPAEFARKWRMDRSFEPIS